VYAALHISEEAPRVGLPPTHIGVHTGPVIFQDGDAFGRTVNIAARIAAQARAGKVLVSHEPESLLRQTHGLPFEALPPVLLKGVSEPFQLFLARAA
jgi:adenylate cyclase